MVSANMMQQTYIMIILLLCLPFSLAISNQTTDNGPIALPGCPTRCGDLKVRYPFGIGAGCSISPWHGIICDTSFNPPKPFLNRTNGVVIDISESKIRFKSNGIASRCYNQIGGVTKNIVTTYTIEASPFTFSDENTFTALGCDDVAYIQEHKSRNLISSCAATCSDVSYLIDGSCSGIGCCQTSIPKGVTNFIAFLNSYQNHTNVFSFNRCGYAFLGEQGTYTFHNSDVNDPDFERRIVETVPMVVEWVIGNLTCAQAKKSTDFACQANSFCVDSDAGRGGYRCNCSKGYKGNPYLKPGCQD